MTPEISDPRIALLGDVHGSSAWVRAALHALHRTDPGITTVVQLGDSWADEALVSTLDLASEIGLERFLVVPGNHERWDILRERGYETTPDPLWLSDTVGVVPRPYHMTIHGREVLCLGGATSLDREYRRRGFDWWPDEALTDEHVAAAIAGPADVMLTHETPDRTPVRQVRAILDGPSGWPSEALDASRESRQRIQQVWDAVKPELLVHGHMHVAGRGTKRDGRRVVSLGRDWQPGALAILDLDDLSVTTVRVPGDGMAS